MADKGLNDESHGIMREFVEQKVAEGVDRQRLLALGESLLRGEVVVDDQD